MVCNSCKYLDLRYDLQEGRIPRRQFLKLAQVAFLVWTYRTGSVRKMVRVNIFAGYSHCTQRQTVEVAQPVIRYVNEFRPTLGHRVLPHLTMAHASDTPLCAAPWPISVQTSWACRSALQQLILARMLG